MAINFDMNIYFQNRLEAIEEIHYDDLIQQQK